MDPFINRLRYSTLFENIDSDAFDAVVKKLRLHKFSKEDVILSAEGPGTELFLLVEGRVKILHRTRTGEELLLALLHPGDFFGDAELIDGRDRTSAVVAVDDCVVYGLAKADFDALIESNHPFTYRLMQVLSIRLRGLKRTFIAEMDRNMERLKVDNIRLQQIIEASQAVNSKLELNDLLNVILETSLHMLDADRGTVYLIDEKKNELWSLIMKGPESIKIQLQMGQGIAGYVAATGDTVNIPDAYLDHRFNPDVDRQSGYRTKTILCMPMKNRDGKIIGVFQLLNKNNGIFTAEDEQIIAAFSVHAAIALENARLYAEERQKIAMEKDLIAAMEVQRTLLPASAPKFRNFECAAKSLPAQNVAGDLFDFIKIDDHRLAICLGDVTGKGLPASLLMANTQATVRSNTSVDITPRSCMERSNDLLHNTIASDKFVTMFYGIIDTQKKTLTYCNAGQENPMHIANGRVLNRLTTGGIPLGLLAGFSYQQGEVPLKEGDMLVIFSDGVTEAVNESNKRFGEEKLFEVILNHDKASSGELVDAIIQAVKNHAGSAAQWDDITVMVIQCGKR